MDKMMKRKRVTALMLCVLMSLSSLPASALEVPEGETFSEIYVSSEGSDKSGKRLSVRKAYDESDQNGRIIVSGTIVIDDYMDILKFSENKNIELSGIENGCILYDGDQNIDPASAVLKVTAEKWCLVISL